MGAFQKRGMLRSSVDGFKELLYLLYQTFISCGPSLEPPRSSKVTAAHVGAGLGPVC